MIRQHVIQELRHITWHAHIPLERDCPLTMRTKAFRQGEDLVGVDVHRDYSYPSVCRDNRRTVNPFSVHDGQSVACMSFEISELAKILSVHVAASREVVAHELQLDFGVRTTFHGGNPSLPSECL